MSASELCDRALRRIRLEPFADAGSPVHGCGGLSAQFSLRRQGSLVSGVRFKASACATLLAYCELVAELATGRSLDDCALLTSKVLASELSGIPGLKRDRAVLAAAAFADAVTYAGNDAPSLS